MTSLPLTSVLSSDSVLWSSSAAATQQPRGMLANRWHGISRCPCPRYVLLGARYDLVKDALTLWGSSPVHPTRHRSAVWLQGYPNSPISNTQYFLNVEYLRKITTKKHPLTTSCIVRDTPFSASLLCINHKKYRTILTVWELSLGTGIPHLSRLRGRDTERSDKSSLSNQPITSFLANSGTIATQWVSENDNAEIKGD